MNEWNEPPIYEQMRREAEENVIIEELTITEDPGGATRFHTAFVARARIRGEPLRVYRWAEFSDEFMYSVDNPGERIRQYFTKTIIAWVRNERRKRK